MPSEKITIVAIVSMTVLECVAMFLEKSDLPTFLLIVGAISVMGGYQIGKLTGIQQTYDHIEKTEEIASEVTSK